MYIPVTQTGSRHASSSLNEPVSSDRGPKGHPPCKSVKRGARPLQGATRLHKKGGVAATGFEPASPGRDLNPQSLAPRASTLSIRSPGALPMSYTAIKLNQPYLRHVRKFIATYFAKREGIET